MKNIYQLQNVAKRLPRLKRKFQQILDKGRRGGHELTENQRAFYLDRIRACEQGLRLLGLELFRRRIGQPELRNTTTFRLRRA